MEDAMTTFDIADIRGFAADLDERMNRCDNGEGMECADLDGTLRHYAALCRELRKNIRSWGRAVFTGRIAFDPEVEKVFRDEGKQLYSRAVQLLDFGDRAEGVCYMLDGQIFLRAALFDLQKLLNHWVTPQLAIGPSARQKNTLTPEQVAEARRRIAALPPLPADWEPTDPRLKMRINKLRKRPGN